jgi:hypothetical protein
MKKSVKFAVIIGVFTLAIFISGLNNQAGSNIAGAPAGYTGSPGDGGFTCATQVGCHTGAPVQPITGIITSNVPGTGYIPGFTYTITATFVRPGHARFGFEVSPQSASGAYLGTLQVTNSTETQIVGAKYITHRTGGITGSGSRIWTFNWKAPVAGTGNVTFYGCFNATNSSNTALGDSICSSTLVVTEDPHTGIQEHTSLEGTLAVFPNPVAVNALITLNYTLKETTSVSVRITDLSGKLIEETLPAKRTEGPQAEQILLPANTTPGIYLVSLQAGNDSQTKRIVVK